MQLPRKVIIVLHSLERDHAVAVVPNELYPANANADDVVELLELEMADRLVQEDAQVLHQILVVQDNLLLALREYIQGLRELCCPQHVVCLRFHLQDLSHGDLILDALEDLACLVVLVVEVTASIAYFSAVSSSSKR